MLHKRSTMAQLGCQRRIPNTMSAVVLLVLTPDLERNFSTFGLVQSYIRKRLGTE